MSKDTTDIKPILTRAIFAEKQKLHGNLIPNINHLESRSLGRGYDISLGLSCYHAMQLALNTLNELNKSQQDKILEGIYIVFERWKNEHGVYPPKTNEFPLSLMDKKQEPAKTYIKRQEGLVKKSGKKLTYLDPWQCADFINSPIGLFYHLLDTDYQFLSNFVQSNDWLRHEYLLATVIIMSSNRHPSDCIEGGIRLARTKLEQQKLTIEIMTPAAKREANRKHNDKIKKQLQKDETERKILAQHAEYKKNCKIPKLEVYKQDLKKKHGEKSKGFSEANISKVLKKYGLNKRNL